MLRIIEDRGPTLVEAQDMVGGYVEIVYLSNGDQMLVNEEGLLIGLPHNREASILSGRRIVGPAVILTRDAKWR